MLTLDHIVVVGRSRKEATSLVQSRLGEAPAAAGLHPHFGTHNPLWGMGADCYLESIAVNPEAPTPLFPRWFGLDCFFGPPRIASWILATLDINAALANLGPEFGVPVTLERGPYKWVISVSKTGDSPFGGYGPALIQWDGTSHPCQDLADSGCRLKTLVVQHPQAAKMQDTFGKMLSDTRVRIVEGSSEISATIQTGNGVVLMK